jgi:predicted HTH domain antitoxin
MAPQSLTVELPEELVALLGSPEAAAAKARTALVFALLREGAISQGQAARVLGVTRRDLLDLMARHGVQSGPETAEEMRREIDNAQRPDPRCSRR